MSNLNAPRDGDATPGEVDRDRLWQELGLEPPAWDDEAGAPPVDEKALRLLLRKELPDALARPVRSLIVRFRSWADALCRVSVEELPDGEG